jgi:uncharacterized iron-regulated membrane protein
MRLLHRWIAPFAVLFLTIIAATGIYLQVDTLRSAYHPVPRATPQALSGPDIAHWVETVLANAQRMQTRGGIAMISLSVDGGRPRADVIWTDSDMPALSLDPTTGSPFQSSVADAADQSMERRLGRLILQLHRGDLFGLPGRWLGLACGIALFTLGITGLILYVTTYRQRIRLRRWSPFW